MKRKAYNRRNNFIGLKFNNLTIIEKTNTHLRAALNYLCECDCGSTTLATMDQLRTNLVRSCEKCKEAFKKERRKETGLKQIYKKYKYQAKRRKIDFLLSKEEFRNLVNGNCFYCSSMHSNEYKIGNELYFKYNGIDRKNNKIAYIKSNCVSCCKYCNRAKMTENKDDFIKWLDNVALFRTIQKDGAYTDNYPMDEK